MSKILNFVFAAVIATSASIIASPLWAQSTPLKKVTYAISSAAVTTGHAHLTSIPIAMGYFKEEGLDVTITPFGGSGEAFNHVISGDVIGADGGTPASIAAIAAGQDLVMAFASITGNPYFVTVPANSSIKSLKDFAGKNIGVYSLSAAGFSLLRGLMILEGVDPKTANFIPISSPAEAADAIKRNRVEVWHAFDIAYAQVASLGTPLRRIATQGDGVGFLAGMSVKREALKRERATLVKLARCFAKGVVFMHENPEAAVRLTWKVYPNTKPIGQTEEQALAGGLRAAKARLENISQVEGLYGNASKAQIQTLLDLLSKGGVLSKPLTPEQVWSSDLIKEANNFNVEAVKRQAREFKH